MISLILEEPIKCRSNNTPRRPEPSTGTRWTGRLSAAIGRCINRLCRSTWTPRDGLSESWRTALSGPSVAAADTFAPLPRRTHLRRSCLCFQPPWRTSRRNTEWLPPESPTAGPFRRSWRDSCNRPVHPSIDTWNTFSGHPWHQQQPGGI